MPENTDTPQEETPFDLDAFIKTRTVGNLRRGPGGAEGTPLPDPPPQGGREDDGRDAMLRGSVDAAPGDDDQVTPAGSEEETPTGTPEETPEERQRRFKSWDEAEEGYRNAQSDLTRRQQEAAKARKEAEAARKEAEAYRERLAAFEREKAEAVMYQELDNFAAEQFQAAQKQVGELDMDADDYSERSARIMAQAETEVRRKARDLEKQLDVPKAATPKADPAPGDDRDTPAGEAPTDGRAEGQRDRGPEAPAVDLDDAQRVLDERMAEEGIDPEDPLFLGYVHKAPFEDENGKALDYEARLDWVITSTKRHRGRERAEAKQQANAPLPRGGRGKPAAKAEKPPEPMSMDAAIQAAREARRVRPMAR